MHFVELDIKRKKDGEIQRFSHFMRLPPNETACFATDLQWNESVLINVITPVKNQVVWLKYLLHSLEEVQYKTKDRNVSIRSTA